MKNAEKKKVIIVGPVYPYNSGIAHYTGLMYRALEKKFDVTMISYKMQYPKLLFKQEQKDYSDKTFRNARGSSHIICLFHTLTFKQCYFFSSVFRL